MNPRWHEEFLSLCALSPDELTEEEWALLQIHLAYCGSCSAAFRQFEVLASGVPPVLAASAEMERDYEGTVTSSPSMEYAENRLMQRLDHTARRKIGIPQFKVGSPYALGVVAASLLCVAGVTGLFVHLSRVSTLRHFVSSSVTAAQTMPPKTQPQREADGFAKRGTTDLELELEKLRRTSRQSNSHVERLTEQLNVEQTARATVDQQRDAAIKELAAEQNENRSLRESLSVATVNLDEQQKHSIMLEAQLNDAASKATEREKVLANESQLLAHDSEIRDLIGARDLYVADINDVGENGKPNKPFGRIFYTKDRSLVFYGYDLDKQSGLTRSVAFQAWGSTDGSHQVSLGMFYQDESHRRWILKFNDAKTLSRLNMVFVTAEPPGGSAKPTGKPLLMAYLQMKPNHP